MRDNEQREGKRGRNEGEEWAKKEKKTKERRGDHLGLISVFFFTPFPFELVRSVASVCACVHTGNVFPH